MDADRGARHRHIDGERASAESRVIEGPQIIARVLAHLQRTAPEQYQPELPLGVRAGTSAVGWQLDRAAWPPDVPGNACGR
jgi:hypothetical protein